MLSWLTLEAEEFFPDEKIFHQILSLRRCAASGLCKAIPRNAFASAPQEVRRAVRHWVELSRWRAQMTNLKNTLSIDASMERALEFARLQRHQPPADAKALEALWQRSLDQARSILTRELNRALEEAGGRQDQVQLKLVMAKIEEKSQP